MIVLSRYDQVVAGLVVAGLVIIVLAEAIKIMLGYLIVGAVLAILYRLLLKRT